MSKSQEPDYSQLLQRLVENIPKVVIQAVSEAHSLGLPTVGLNKAREVVRTWPDGSKEILLCLLPSQVDKEGLFDPTQLTK